MSPLNSRSQEYYILQQYGVTILNHTNGLDDNTVQAIFGKRAKVEKNITRNCFPNSRYEGDWAKAGDESWYSVAKISTGLFGFQIPVALKAIVSMGGDCRGRAYAEADRLVRLAPHAPKVYAVAPCTIVKEWLVPDRPGRNDEQLYHELTEFMGQVHISLTNSRIQSAAIISGGMAKVIDAGWDMTG